MLVVAAVILPVASVADPFFPESSAETARSAVPSAAAQDQLMGVMLFRRQRLALVRQRAADPSPRWWLLRVGDLLPSGRWTVAAIDGRGAIFVSDGGDNARHLYRYPGQALPQATQASPLATQESPQATQASPLATQASPQAIQESPPAAQPQTDDAR